MNTFIGFTQPDIFNHTFNFTINKFPTIFYIADEKSFFSIVNGERHYYQTTSTACIVYFHSLDYFFNLLTIPLYFFQETFPIK